MTNTKSIPSDQTPLPTLLPDVAMIDTGSTPEQGPRRTKVPPCSEEKTEAGAASSVSDVLDQQSKRRAKASPVRNRSPGKKKHAPKNGRAEYQSHQEHLIQSSETQETLSLSSLSPGAIHIQRGKSPPPPDEWDNITEHSDGGRDVSSDLVVTASLVPDEEDLAELVEKRMEKKIQKAIVVEATSSNSLDRAKCRRYAFALVIIVLAVIGTVAGVTINLMSDNEVPTNDVPKAISLDTDAHPNNMCSAALAIASGIDKINGSITTSDGPYFNNMCPLFQNEPFGTSWYSLIGNGKIYLISTCASDLSFDSAVSVFSGSCDTHECIAFAAENDDDCNESLFNASTVMFHAIAGVEYLISVASTNNAIQGMFSLSILTLEPPSNDLCTSAEPIDPSVGIVHGSVSNATSSSPFEYSCYLDYSLTNDHDVRMPNVWYSLIGDDYVYLISTCSNELSFLSGITVFTGSCDSLECVLMVTANDLDCEETSAGAASVVFRAMAGVEYFISVENLNNTLEGEFSLSILILEPPSNDICSTAEAIDLSVGAVKGSIISATQSSPYEYSCFDEYGWTYNSPTPNVWYSLMGDGKAYLISMRTSELNFAGGLAVLTGSCDSLECVVRVANNDYDFNLETSTGIARVLFRTTAGVEYLISVEYHNSTMEWVFNEDFNLVITPVTVPGNDLCSGALLMQPGSGAIYASTLNATDSLVNISLGYQMNSDLWYRVEGTGTLLNASTCGEGTLFDTTLSVFEGIDGECDQSLIVSDDDFCAPGSQVEWFAETGSTYYIRVYGYDGMSGSFQLEVT